MQTLIRTLACSCLLATALPVLADPVRDLVVASQMDNGSFARKLIGDGLSPNTIDPVSHEPVLLVALREGSTAVIDVLLAHPDLNTEMMAPNGNTALMMAAFKGNKRAVAGLLAKGAVIAHPGWNALHYAAAGGDSDIIKMLLDKGAPIDAEAPGRTTALMMAAREGKEVIVAQLLREGADARRLDSDNMTASQIASSREFPRIAAMIDAALARQASK